MIEKITNWTLQATGKSYWHQPLPFSIGFRANDLSLYFIDNTGKTNWTGAADGDGIPLLVVDGNLTAFPTTVFQKALGHWNIINSVASNGDTACVYDCHRSQFLIGAKWAEENIGNGGGWKLPFGPSPYSAMTQGQGISVLVRAYHLTGEKKYLHLAMSAFQLFSIPTASGGVVGSVEGLPFLEEFPNSRNVSVLNGAIFALFGIYDLYVKTNESSHFNLFKVHLKAIGELLPRYDLGYWSRYDLSGNIASPFYHNLHIAQLKALAVLDENGPFDGMEKRFMKYGENVVYCGLAIFSKIKQKLFAKEPSHGSQRL